MKKWQKDMEEKVDRLAEKLHQEVAYLRCKGHRYRWKGYEAWAPAATWQCVLCGHEVCLWHKQTRPEAIGEARGGLPLERILKKPKHD